MSELMSEGKEKTCPRCGASFLCTHDALCQCTGICLNDNARAYLRTHYSDCLCRQCLLAISRQYSAIS